MEMSSETEYLGQTLLNIRVRSARSPGRSCNYEKSKLSALTNGSTVVNASGRLSNPPVAADKHAWRSLQSTVFFSPEQGRWAIAYWNQRDRESVLSVAQSSEMKRNLLDSSIIEG